VFIEYGERWRRYRRALHPHMQKNAVQDYWPIQTNSVHIFLQSLLDAPEQFSANIQVKGNREIMGSVYGFNVTSVANKYLSRMEESLHCLERAVVPGAFLVDVFPKLVHIPNWFPGGGFKRTAAEWKRIHENSITSPFEVVKEQVTAGTAAPSIVSGMLESGEFEDDIIKWVCGSMYAAGSDTTTETLRVFFLAMTLHPEVVQRAQKELERVVGTERLPTMDDRPNLPYIESIMKEVLRWAPVGPLAIPHSTTEEDEYKGYRIPAGTTVLMNMWAIGQDERLYDNPSRFWPERLDVARAAGKEIIDPSAWVWGLGRRACPGRHWAESTLFLTMASVLATFNISKARDEFDNEIEPDRAVLRGLVNRAAPFKCSIKPRSQTAVSLIKNSTYFE